MSAGLSVALACSFSFLPGPGPGLCSCVVCGASWGFCSVPSPERLVGDDPRTDPFLTFRRESRTLYRYLSTPVYVYVIRCHLQGARVIVAYTSMGGSQVVHIDDFILEFLALLSFLFVQVVAIAAFMLMFDFFASQTATSTTSLWFTRG